MRFFSYLKNVFGVVPVAAIIASLNVNMSEAIAQSEQKPPRQQIEEIISQYRQTLPQRGSPYTVILDVEVKNKHINWTVRYEGYYPTLNKLKFAKMTKLETALVNCQFEAKRNVLRIGYKHHKTYVSKDGDQLFHFTISKSDCPNIDFEDLTGVANKYISEISKLLPMEMETGSRIVSADIVSNEMVFQYKDDGVHFNQLSELEKELLTESLVKLNCTNQLRRFFIEGEIDMREMFLNARNETEADIVTTKSDCLSQFN
jgi:hypothetical protein